MFRKLPLKIKIVILTFFCIIGIGIVIKNGIDNWENSSKNKLNVQTKEQASIKSNKIDLNNLEEQAKEKQADKIKELEVKYEEGYNDFHSGKYTDAINKEDEVLAVDPNFYKAHSLKGIALCYLSPSRYQEGMDEIDKALQIKSDYGYGRFNKALAYELTGHYDEALQWYDKALEVENNYVWSYYGKASIYGRRGDVKNCVENLKSALALAKNQSVKEAAKKEDDFANVRNSKEFQELIK